ncbi:MAG: DUF924 family protein [Bdellovibrionales bacterium]|jgi:uncharacterized protein (DUF924 family)|nr:DUF924 family protein [Bdellovibrionales bacterium]
MSAESVNRFWFEETDSKQWFMKSEEFDHTIRTRFLGAYERIVRGETASWRTSPHGRLAEIIVLDQFARNMFRDTPQAFAADGLALWLSREMIRRGDDQALEIAARAFVYMPFMHSENPLDHVEAVRLFSQPGLEYNLKFEHLHKDIVDRFGRYPHRNQVLGRISTPEEVEFLKTEGSSF